MTCMKEFKARIETWRNADGNWLVTKESYYVDGINIVWTCIVKQKDITLDIWKVWLFVKIDTEFLHYKR
jgi:hypothetical protein